MSTSKPTSSKPDRPARLPPGQTIQAPRLFRSTRQRAAIRRALEGADRPLTPLELHQSAKLFCPDLGLRTVYREIRTLASQGRLVGVDYPGQPVRYERVSQRGPHPHFICRHCGKVYELAGMAVELPSLCPPPGFLIEGGEVVYSGRCPACQTADHAAAGSGATAASGKFG